MSQTDTPPRKKTAKLIAGFVVGVLLIAVAVFVLVQNKQGLDGAIDSAKHAPAWLIALAVLLPLVNAGLVSLSFWTLMRKFGAVPLGDMFALIGSAWLLNYLPLRPGLVGRLAFHKLVHGVSLKSSIAVSVALAIMTALAAGHMLLVGIAFVDSTPVGVVVPLASSAVVYVVAGIAADKSPAGAVPRKDLRLALLVRYGDMLVWALRMWVCFAIVGADISPSAALLIAAAAQLASLFPLTGAGLGVVEWAVGFVAAIVVVSATTEIGLAASLVNRAAELIVVVPAGLLGSAYIARRRTRMSQKDPTETA